MSNNPLCHEDGAEMVRDTRPITLSYKGESVTINLPGWYCPQCGESVHDGKDMRVSDRALNAMKARVEGLMPAQEIRRIRKRLGLTQEEAGKIVGGGPKAFTKYENGDLLPSRAIANLLKVLDACPEQLIVLTSSTSSGKCDCGRDGQTEAVA